MQILILPGFHPKNQKWAEETKIELDPFFPTTAYSWAHWKTEKPEKNWVEVESKRILELAQGSAVNVIAKSIGTLVAAYIIGFAPKMVNKLVLCGIPLNDIGDKDKINYNSLTKISSEKIIVIQNEEDPHANFEQVKEFLDKINKQIAIISKPGSDHEYYYSDAFLEFLK